MKVSPKMHRPRKQHLSKDFFIAGNPLKIITVHLGGGFKHFLFSSLPREMILFD